MKKPVNTWDEWHQRHRRFPGVEFCVELLKRRNTQGELIETICGVLENNATENVDELLAAVDNPDNDSVRIMLLGVIENVALKAAVPLWTRILQSSDQSEHTYAVSALKLINTKEARRILWEAGVT